MDAIINKIQIDKDINIWNDVGACIIDVYTTNETIKKYDLALDIHIKLRVSQTPCQNLDHHDFYDINLMKKQYFFKWLCLLNVNKKLFTVISCKKREVIKMTLYIGGIIGIAEEA